MADSALQPQAAVHKLIDRADRAGLDQPPGGEVDIQVARDVGHGEGQPPVGGFLDKLPGLRRIHRHRHFDDHMFVSLQGGQGLRVMECMGGGDDHGIDAGIVERLGQVGGGPGDAALPGEFVGRLLETADDPAKLNFGFRGKRVKKQGGCLPIAHQGQLQRTLSAHGCSFIALQAAIHSCAVAV